jgi:hypothetical protein
MKARDTKNEPSLRILIIGSRTAECKRDDEIVKKKLLGYTNALPGDKGI